MRILPNVSGAAGLDEAGRGPLAGPVAAAAVILPDGMDLSGIFDSKQLTMAAREDAEARIKAEAIWTVELVDADEIDRINILRASLTAMVRALNRLPTLPIEALVDGNHVPKDMPCPARAIVKGDGKVACIAAAGILAKTQRDRIMRAYAEEFPGYGFEHHFGYPTPEHIRALKELGPSPIHRKSFGIVRDLLQPNLFS